jgi:hypothetical protein
MERNELELARIKFEYLDFYLNLCDQWSVTGRSLSIWCTDAIAAVLLDKLEALVLKFEGVEQVIINGEVAQVSLNRELDLPMLTPSDEGEVVQLDDSEAMQLDEELPRSQLEQSSPLPSSFVPERPEPLPKPITPTTVVAIYRLPPPNTPIRGIPLIKRNGI